MLPLRDNVPTRSRPLVTYALIVANILIWVLYQLPDLQGSVDELAYHPCEVEGSCPTIGQGWLITVFTSMFLHGGWAHLLGNMLFLWIFGNNLEDALGRARFLFFYVAGGLVATAVQSFVTLGYASELEGTIPNVGASGAISAVLGGYLVLLPRAQGADPDRLRAARDPGRVLPPLLVRLPAPGRERLDRASAGRRRGRVLRPYRRLRLRRALRQTAPAATTTRTLALMTFEEHVTAALDSLPPHLAAALDNVAVVIEEANREEPDLYGLFDWPEYMPAKISIYRRPLVEDFEDPAELEEQIRVTVLHELAHYFGMDEDRIADLGYD